MFKRILIWGLLLMALSSCTSKGNFTRAERELIKGCDSIFRVLTIDNPADVEVLRSKSVNLSDKALLSKDFGRLSELMIATVTHPSQDGVGIAGPQVGLNRRVIAVQRFDKGVEHEDGSEDYPFEVYVNIRIVEASDSLVRGGEGCLSVPDMNGDVLRSEEIVIEYTDYSGEADASGALPVVRERVSGFTAVIFQHEIDHLDGVLYIDKAVPEEEKHAEESSN